MSSMKCKAVAEIAMLEYRDKCVDDKIQMAIWRAMRWQEEEMGLKLLIFLSPKIGYESQLYKDIKQWMQERRLTAPGRESYWPLLIFEEGYARCQREWNDIGADWLAVDDSEHKDRCPFCHNWDEPKLSRFDDLGELEWQLRVLL